MNETHDYYIGKDRPQTAKKLSILRKYFAVWLTIWAGDSCSSWVAKRWYVIDLFAGTGQAKGVSGETLSGSPLVFLEEIRNHVDRLAARGITIDLILVEQNAERHGALAQRVEEFFSDNPDTKNLIEVRCLRGDANEVVDGIVLSETSESPCFLLIDPFGLEVQHDVVSRLVARPWRMDALFNYMVESVRRAYGVATGSSSRADANWATLQAYFGPDVHLDGPIDVENPATYARAVFIPHGHKVVAFRMKKPGTIATQYVLLFASRNDTVIRVMRDVYAKEMTDYYGQVSFFGTEEYLDDIEVIC